MHIKYSSSAVLISLSFFLSCNSYPQSKARQGTDEVEIEMMPEPLEPKDAKFKQEDTDTEVEADETTIPPPPGPSFGSQVAQIITGVATGDLGSILQGSFNLIPDTQHKQATNGAWETIAGITSTAAPTTTTTTPTPTTEATEATQAPTTEAPEPETEETKAEVTSESSDDSPSTSTASTTNNEDDDDDEESRAEGGEEEGGDTETEDLDTSVYSRSKVLRVI